MSWYSCLRPSLSQVSSIPLAGLCVNAEPPSLPLLPSSPLWQSLLEYHLSDQPCQRVSTAPRLWQAVPQATTAAGGNQPGGGGGAGSSLQGKQTLPLLAILADQGASWSALQASDHLLWSPKGKQAGRDSLQPDWPSVLGLLPCPLPEGSLMASRYPAVQGST